MADPIKIPKKSREAVKKMAQELCNDSAKKIADACNAESSWGFYESYEGDNAAFVVGLVHEASSANDRAQRILRNVHRGDV